MHAGGTRGFQKKKPYFQIEVSFGYTFTCFLVHTIDTNHPGYTSLWNYEEIADVMFTPRDYELENGTRPREHATTASNETTPKRSKPNEKPPSTPSTPIRSFDSNALFSVTTRNNAPTGVTGDSGSRLLEAIRDQASKGAYRINIFFARPPPMPKDHHGWWRGKVMVFFELYHSIKEEGHWAFRPDHFGRITALAREHGAGIPEILLPVISLPKRSKEDSYKQAARQVRLPNGNSWTISECILAFAVPWDKTDEEIRVITHKHLDALAHPTTKKLYYEQRKNNSTDKLKAEIDPDKGPMWNTLRSARMSAVLQQVPHLDMVITTDAAVEVVREMFDIQGGPESWTDRSIASFATFRY